MKGVLTGLKSAGVTTRKSQQWHRIMIGRIGKKTYQNNVTSRMCVNPIQRRNGPIHATTILTLFQQVDKCIQLVHAGTKV